MWGDRWVTLGCTIWVRLHFVQGISCIRAGDQRDAGFTICMCVKSSYSPPEKGKCHQDMLAPVTGGECVRLAGQICVLGVLALARAGVESADLPFGFIPPRHRNL